MIRISEIFHSVQGEGKLTGTPSVFVRTSGCNLRCSFCDTPYASWAPEGEFYTEDSLLETVKKLCTEKQCTHVVITGGEPAIFDPIGSLIDGLKSQGLHITIETAGTVYRDWACDLWSISPKLSNSDPSQGISANWMTQHRERRHAPDVVSKLIATSLVCPPREPLPNKPVLNKPLLNESLPRGLPSPEVVSNSAISNTAIKDYQLKFVVGSPEDTVEVLDYLEQVTGWDKANVLFMPKGTTPEELQLVSTWLAPWCQEHGFGLCDRKHIYWFGNTRGT